MFTVLVNLDGITRRAMNVCTLDLIGKTSLSDTSFDLIAYNDSLIQSRRAANCCTQHECKPCVNVLPHTTECRPSHLHAKDRGAFRHKLWHISLGYQLLDVDHAFSYSVWVL